jgi:phosphate transport system permease protein
MKSVSELLFQRRKVKNIIGLVISCLAMIAGLSFLGAILWTLLVNGIPAIGKAIFTQMTPPPGGQGGLLNAIYGSFLMVGLATLIGTPVGISAGVYLAEYGGQSKLASVVRFLNGILLSMPTVIIGFFVYTLVVFRFKHFSGWAGIAALSIIVIPVVVNTTENMLRLVPNSLREAAAALGAPRWKISTSVTYEAAKSGILTGVLLGVARISGETAPLLFTALNNQFWSSDLAKPMANLPVVIFQFAMSPYTDWQSLAWGGALIITFSVLFLNIVARLMLRKKA